MFVSSKMFVSCPPNGMEGRQPNCCAFFCDTSTVQYNAVQYSGLFRGVEPVLKKNQSTPRPSEPVLFPSVSTVNTR